MQEVLKCGNWQNRLEGTGNSEEAGFGWLGFGGQGAGLGKNALEPDRVAIPGGWVVGGGLMGARRNPGKFTGKWQHLGLDSLSLDWGRGQGSGGCHGSVSPRYRAMYQYRPQNEDELELREGDRVDVMQQCDDGWFVGMWAWQMGCSG